MSLSAASRSNAATRAIVLGLLLVLLSPPAVAVHRAAAVKVDITPGEPLRLGGDPQRGTPADGIETRLHARVLLLRDDTDVLTVLVSVETGAISEWLRERVCGAIRWRTGIYRSRISFCATGTRCAPRLHGIDEPLAELTDDQAAALRSYGDLVVTRVVGAIVDAVQSTREVVVTRAGGRDSAGDAVDVLSVRMPDGDQLAVVFLHPGRSAVLGGGFNYVCGDWPGHAAAAIETAVPGCVALPLVTAVAGATRDAPDAGDVDAARRVGEEIADRVTASLATSRGETDAGETLGAIDTRFEYAPIDGWRAPLQVWRAERLAIAFLPGEVPPDAAARLRSADGRRPTWVVGHANGHPPARLAPWPRDREGALVGRAVEIVSASATSLAGRIKPPPPRPPREALESITVAPGFRVELAAAEPHVTDPVAIAFDASGALYACEMRDYPEGPGAGKPPDGRVRRLEDRDGDGYFEHARIFAARLGYPCGLVCSRDGVLVAAETEIVFLRDTDGDGEADERRVVLDGFRPGNSQHLLNSLTWGIDNRIWVNGGDGARIRDPSQPGAPPLVLERSNFRIDPRSLAVERATGYQGGFGIAFTDAHERIVCSSTNHGRQVVFDTDDLAGNSDLAVGDVLRTLTDHDHTIFPASGPLERFNDPADVGRFSSACGVHVAGGDRLPESHRGNLFVCEPVSNLVHRDVLERDGATLIARRGEERGEFLASTDHWFRPVFVTTGPDGSLWIADMYREVIEHPEWIPAHVQRLFDLRSGMDRGRIYRVVHESSSPRPRIDLSRTESHELVDALRDAGAWRRRTAQRLLVERESRDVVAALERLARDAAAPAHARWHALWTLDGLGALEPGIVSRALEDADATVRAHAVLLARALAARGGDGKSAAGPGETLTAALARRADDPDPLVRFRTALALGALPAAERAGPLARIAALDAGDHWTRTAVLLSAVDRPLDVLRRVLESAPAADGVAAFQRAVADLVGRRGRPDEIVAALELLLGASTSRDDTTRLTSVSALLGALGAGGVERALADRPGAAVALRRRLAGVLDRAAALARDDRSPPELRGAAIAIAGHGDADVSLPLLSGLLAPRNPAGVQAAAIDALGVAMRGGSRDAVVDVLLAAFPRLSPALRDRAVDAVLRDPGGAVRLIGAIESGVLRAVDLGPSRRRALLEHGDAAVRARADAVLGALRADPDRAAVVERYREAIAALDDEPDRDHGRAIFVKHCSTCHRRDGVGAVVGPDLGAVRQRAADALIIDLLDPNRSVSPEYLGYVVVTRSGEVIGGLLLSETPGSVFIRRTDGHTEAILRRDIVELRSSGQSVMPEGLERDLTPRDVRDVIDVIRS